MATVVFGDYEWDDTKAFSNLNKHGVSFDEAVTVMVDANVVFLDDSSGDGRMLAIGMSAAARVLVVVHIDTGKRDRIISARLATRGEESVYTQGG